MVSLLKGLSRVTPLFGLGCAFDSSGLEFRKQVGDYNGKGRPCFMAWRRKSAILSDSQGGERGKIYNSRRCCPREKLPPTDKIVSITKPAAAVDWCIFRCFPRLFVSADWIGANCNPKGLQLSRKVGEREDWLAENGEEERQRNAGFAK